MHVLVIDDEISVAVLISRVLSDAGHRCTLATSTDEADRILSAGEVDAMTLDLAIPGSDSLRWLEALAARDPAVVRRTLVVSASAIGHSDMDRIRRRGAGFLAKPFRLEELAEAFGNQVEAAGPGRPTQAD